MLNNIHYRIAISCMLVSTILCFARPANTKIVSVKNADGSELSVRYFGDEHFYYAKTTDGFIVAVDKNKNYVYVNNSGEASNVIANNKEFRSEQELQFIKNLDKEKVKANYTALNSYTKEQNFTQILLQKNNKPLIQKRPSGEKWTVGERYFPVLLVGTSDKAYGDSIQFYEFFNEPNYNKNENIGSLRDYFLFVSDKKFNPHFDVYPVTIEASLESFGSGSNFSEYDFVAAAVDTLTSRADFLENAQKYCSSNKDIDGFILLYPGEEAEALKQSSTFWSHQYWLRDSYNFQYNYYSKGYNFDKYMFSAQYADGSKNTEINLMGIYAHEFSHVLGLNDYYYNNGNITNYGSAEFEIMSRGMYNNDGYSPVGYSAFEKSIMGWLTLEELKPDSNYALEKASKMQAFSVTNPKHNDEYYIIEYRPKESYDSYIDVWDSTTNGIFVWYVDYNKTAFEKNEANKDSTHFRMILKNVLKQDDSFASFNFVNENANSQIAEIYNVSFESDSIANFTTKLDSSSMSPIKVVAELEYEISFSYNDMFGIAVDLSEALNQLGLLDSNGNASSLFSTSWLTYYALTSTGIINEEYSTSISLGHNFDSLGNACSVSNRAVSNNILFDYPDYSNKEKKILYAELYNTLKVGKRVSINQALVSKNKQVTITFNITITDDEESSYTLLSPKIPQFKEPKIKYSNATINVKNNIATISLPNAQFTQIHLFDAQGRVLYKTNFYANQASINLNGFGSGAFILRLSNEKNILLTKRIRLE